MVRPEAATVIATMQGLYTHCSIVGALWRWRIAALLEWLRRAAAGLAAPPAGLYTATLSDGPSGPDAQHCWAVDDSIGGSVREASRRTAATEARLHWSLIEGRAMCIIGDLCSEDKL